MAISKERMDERYPLWKLTKGLTALIKRAHDFKKKEFQDDADELMEFFTGTCNIFGNDATDKKRGYMSGDREVPVPDFHMKLLKINEGEQLIGPALYANNPQTNIHPQHHLQFSPEELGMNIQQPQVDPNTGQPGPMDPQSQMMAQQYQQLQMVHASGVARRTAAAKVIEKLINYYQRELDKRSHARRGIRECLVKGMGVGWTEPYEFTHSGMTMVGTFYDSVDNLLQDPDAEMDEEVLWIARKRCEPVWQVAERFGMPEDVLRAHANMESVASQYMKSADNSEWLRKLGKTNDLLVYWDWYSKMGMGDLLTGVPPKIRGEFDEFGDYCYLAVCSECPYPLNLHPKVMKGKKDDKFLKTQWPIPFWADGLWPVSKLAFRPVPGRLWPMGHFQAGLGELKWLTWAFSFLANKVRTSCGTIVGVAKAAGADIKAALESNEDNKIVELEDILGRSVGDVISFLQQPPFHGDIWKVIEAVMMEFEKRTGLSEILYGMSMRSDRSATESRIKNENAGSRIDDMATLVEQWLEEINRKEAMAIRWILRPEDVADIIGPQGTQVFVQEVKALDLEQVAREFSYEVVPGSTRRKSKAAVLDDMNLALQAVGPVLSQMVQNGVVGPWNAMVEDWSDAMGFAKEKAQRYLIPQPEPQPDPAIQTEQLKQETEKIKLAMKMQADQMKAALDQQKAEMDLEVKRVELQLKEAEMRMKLESMREEMQLEREKVGLEMEAAQQEHVMGMVQNKQQADQEMAISSSKANSEAQLAQTKAKADLDIQKQSAEIKNQQVKQQGEIKAKQMKMQGDTKVGVMKEQSKAKVQATKAQAKAKPKAKKK